MKEIVVAALVVGSTGLACSSEDTSQPSTSTGGSVAIGGNSASGGVTMGGAAVSGGQTTRPQGGSATSGGGVGGDTASGARGGSAATGGNTTSGGRSAGGSSATGGNSNTGGRSLTGGGSPRSGSAGTGGKALGSGGNGLGGSSTGGTTTGGSGGSSGTANTRMYTSGSDLFAHCGEKVVLRGVNQMSVWTDPTGSSYPAIASFGSNAIRIVYQTSGSAAGLDALLTKAEANKMIAMPELHDATGKFGELTKCVNWWAKPDVVSVINKHERWTLLNIANEAGDGTVSNSTFQSAYTSAITTLRNAGIRVPLVIDGSGWGQNVEQLLAVAPALLAADPQRNVIFSWHEYTGGAQQNARITSGYEKSKSLGIVLINGEFANAGAGSCTPNIPYKFLLSEAQRLGIGWFAWSWDVGNSDCKSGGTSVFDMTTNITSASAVVPGWASDVMRDDPNSIKNTSIRHCEWK